MISAKDIKVAIIVPVYKAEGTLAASVRSIQAQTHDNLEIILVDDGSPDKCGEICDSLAADDNRIIVIHKQNGGVSSARNIGLLKATADYVCFMDSDDEIETTMVEKLLKAKISSSAQMVIAGVTEYHKNLIKQVCENNIQYNLNTISNEEIKELCSKTIMCFSTVKLFERKIFTENKLIFKEGLVCGEDHLLIFQYLYYCEKICFINEALYRYYCYNSNGAARFFPLSGQIDIFNAKRAFVCKHMDTQAADEYCAVNALRNLIARFNYLAKRSIENYEELAQAYDTYWPYIAPFIERPEIFPQEDKAWLTENRKSLETKNIKKVYAFVKKAFAQNSKHRRNIKEFLNMSAKEKIKFIIRKIKK